MDSLHFRASRKGPPCKDVHGVDWNWKCTVCSNMHSPPSSVTALSPVLCSVRSLERMLSDVMNSEAIRD